MTPFSDGRWLRCRHGGLRHALTLAGNQYPVPCVSNPPYDADDALQLRAFANNGWPPAPSICGERILPDLGTRTAWDGAQRPGWRLRRMLSFHRCNRTRVVSLVESIAPVARAYAEMRPQGATEVGAVGEVVVKRGLGEDARRLGDASASGVARPGA